MSIEYDKLDKSTSPIDQSVKLGALIKGSPVIVKTVISADATGEKAVTIPYDMEVVDVVVRCTATSGGGTLTLKNGTAVTDAIACATDKAVTRAGSIDPAYSTLYTYSTVTIDAAQAGDRGVVWIIGYRI